MGMGVPLLQVPGIFVECKHEYIVNECNDHAFFWQLWFLGIKLMETNGNRNRYFDSGWFGVGPP